MNSLFFCPQCKTENLSQEGDFLSCSCKARFQIEKGIPLFSSSEITPCLFEKDALMRLERMEQGHFWFQGRRTLVASTLERLLPSSSRIADLGCGTGLLLGELVEKGYDMSGIDMHPSHLIKLLQRHPKVLLAQSNVENTPFKDASFDAVLLLDVLEHVDDEKTLAEAYRLLKRGGIVLILTPAYSWLWGLRDVNAGHLRRYSRKKLRVLVETQHFILEEERYYQSILFPVFLISRLMGKLFPRLLRSEESPPKFLNRLFSFINCFEAKCKRSLPFGSTLLAVGRKG